ncbi:MAG TPA: hypothetical protein VD694_05295 [Nitrososphaeraceae archaeon]|jgi:hypothetical protein|nr:hypothetical protein [Nitrososphaeraceae archaeon]
MDYTNYLSILYDYERKDVGSEEKSILFKVINSVDLSAQIGSYLKLRDKNQFGDSSAMSKLLSLKLLSEKKGLILRGTRKYQLTSIGLFYVLNETRTYPPSLLKKYSDDPILKSLLYQYFEVDTISTSSGRFFSLITHYLRQCCRITLNWLEDTQNSNEEHKNKVMNHLLFELELNAKLLALRILITYSDSNILTHTPKSESGDSDVAYYEIESSMKETLGRDKKFIELLHNTNADFKSGFKEFTNSK